jgi:hypothetical protein
MVKYTGDDVMPIVQLFEACGWKVHIEKDCLKLEERPILAKKVGRRCNKRRKI